MIMTMRFMDPGVLAVYLSIYMVLAFLSIAIIYYILRTSKERTTTMYLSGESEEIVSNPTPSPSHLYWAIMSRFAAKLYDCLRERMHTGNLQDWIGFMTSWYGLLLVVSIIIGLIYTLAR